MEDHPHPRPIPKYPVPVTHGNICAVFQGAADLNIRRIVTGPAGREIRLYAIDSDVGDAAASGAIAASIPGTRVGA